MEEPVVMSMPAVSQASTDPGQSNVELALDPGTGTVVDRTIDDVAGPIGFLTNVYPSVSHSFIRREILALEHRGLPIARFSVRRAIGALPDPKDQHEQSRTTVLLDAGRTALLVAALRLALLRPRRFWRAMQTMTVMRRAAGGGWMRHAAYLAEAALLVRMAELRDIRHIHVHFGTNPAAVARLAKIMGAISYSMTVHGPEEFDAPLALSLPQKIADATFVVAISSYGRGQLMRWCGRDDWKKLAVVRCGLDAQFLDQPADPAVAPSRRTFVCIARLDRQKGLSLLLDATATVAASHDVDLRIIGDGEMRAELVAQIAALGLGSRVHMLGSKSAAAIRDELTAARALILPSFAEGLPVVLMEALVLERPVIATLVAGVPELVDSHCGWLVPAGCASALATAMIAVLEASDDSLRAQGAVGHARVRERHDAAINTGLLADLLRASWQGRPVEPAIAA